MSHTRRHSTLTRAGGSTSKMSILFVCRQAADLHLRRQQLCLQRQHPRPQLHLRPRLRPAVRLQPRRGRRRARAFNRPPGFALHRRRGRKTRENWSVAAEYTQKPRAVASTSSVESRRDAWESVALARELCGTFGTANPSCGERGRIGSPDSGAHIFCETSVIISVMLG